ncbi:MAG: polysulfide reductase NrfD [Coriobacteriia bacterium]|nr:polysulfide reductase NrfD [Coriobacteriia bacterium]
MNGLGVTGMNNSNSWGLYITMFMLFVGLSAGGLIVASSAHVFHIEPFKKVAVPAVIVSLVCICCAGIFVLVDLGGIARVWRIVTGPNLASPLLWDIVVITTYLVINVLDLVWLVKGDHRKVEVLSRVALPVAILVHSVTAWIFGLQIAKAWYSAIMAPIFVASACDSGLALLLVSLMILDKVGLFKLEDGLMQSLAGLLACFIAVDAFFIGCECLTMAYPGAHEAQALGIMVGGVTAPFFWVEILLGLLVPFCVLVFAKNRKNRKLVTVASVLVILGVFCKRVWLLFTSFVVPNVLGGPGITTGNSAALADPTATWTAYGAYAPTAPEIVIAVGVVSLGVAAAMALCHKLLGKADSQPAAAAQAEPAAA